MKIREQILKEHSKANCDLIVKWVGDSQQRFDHLCDLFLHDDYRLAQRASWPLSNSVMQHPHLIRKHFTKLLNNLERPGIHNAVRRNTIRLLQDLEIPTRFQGRVMSICFKYLESPTEKVAVKAFSMTVLYNLSKNYPDIIPELRILLEERWDQESAAFRSRARKILGKLK